MITQQRLHEIIRYSRKTGIAYWRKGERAGKRAGRVQISKRGKTAYRYVFLTEGWKGQKPFSHVIFFYITGRWPEEEMDHKNGDSLDDRWVNLRESTREQNEANRGPRRNNKLGLKGVRLCRSGKYDAAIYRGGKRTWLGEFDTPQEASEAYLAAAAKNDGDFLRI